MHGVVVVVKLHDTAHEWIVGVLSLFYVPIVVVLDRDHDLLLEQVRCLDDGVSEEFPEVFHLLDSLELNVCFDASLEIWVTQAVLHSVTDLFASGTPHILVVLGTLNVLIVSQIVILVIFRLVLAELASWLVLALFTATPPHFATIVTLMLPATPMEVLTLTVLLIAIFASFETTVKFALTLDEFLDADLRLLFL